MYNEEQRGIMKRFIVIVKLVTVVIGLSLSCLFSPVSAKDDQSIGMAVEFMDHAASAYVALDKGWFREHGLELSAFQNYVTGMALAAALARGDIQVAYICLVPALSCYANAGVPIKIILGTHKYGYGLVVNPQKIKEIKDLEKPGIRIGCVREGGTVDILLHKTIDRFGLDSSKILKKVQRMNPPKQLLAIKMGRLDAAFLPEQWATMATEYGFKMLLTAKDLWPEMQGSVVVVKEDLIKKHPAKVKALVKVTEEATDWINRHPYETAQILARQLSLAGRKVFPTKLAPLAAEFEISSKVLERSMARMEYTTSLDPKMVQEVIDYMVKLGYLKRRFRARDILDLEFMR